MRCRAGAVAKAVFGTVPALRSSVKNAAPRPGHQAVGRLDSDSIEASILAPNSRREMRHGRCPFALFAIRKPASRKSLRAMRQADRRTRMVRKRPAPHGIFVEMSGLRLPVRGGGVFRQR